MAKPRPISNLSPLDPRYPAVEPAGPLDLQLARALAVDLASHKQTAAAALLRYMIAELELMRAAIDRSREARAAAELNKWREAFAVKPQATQGGLGDE